MKTSLQNLNSTRKSLHKISAEMLFFHQQIALILMQISVNSTCKLKARVNAKDHISMHAATWLE